MVQPTLEVLQLIAESVFPGARVSAQAPAWDGPAPVPESVTVTLRGSTVLGVLVPMVGARKAVAAALLILAGGEGKVT